MAPYSPHPSLSPPQIDDAQTTPSHPGNTKPTAITTTNGKAAAGASHAAGGTPPPSHAAGHATGTTPKATTGTSAGDATGTAPNSTASVETPANVDVKHAVHPEVSKTGGADVKDAAVGVKDAVTIVKDDALVADTQEQGRKAERKRRGQGEPSS